MLQSLAILRTVKNKSLPFIVMSNIQVSVRIPPHLYEKLLAHTNTLGLSKSKVIAQALSNYLEADDPKPSSLEDRMMQLEQRLISLESTSPETEPLKKADEISPKPLPLLKIPSLQQLTVEVPTVNENGEIIERVSHQVKSFKEELGDGVELDMIYIPGGTFLMGSPETEMGSQLSERPQHSITLKGFFLGQFPITQAQWQVVAHYPKVKRDLNLDPAFFKGSDRPVERISWEDAVEFCDRLSQHSQRPYKVPSEAQWEYACRAGTTTPFSFGPTLTGDLANYMAKHLYAGEKLGIYRQETTPVGQFFPNTFGLYDVHGNVWEWCADTWHSNYQDAPISEVPWMSLEHDKCRVLRGGSWDNDAPKCRCASRYSYHPQAVPVNQIGFRVMCNLGG
ncbi:SUMF1/EgtB/PvdO family nonheme iron enzyme [Crocosphaera sp. UHCC 0190]|uniref:SUMF1/EgtB/PvdO family nonheme iron enzyme n=1 Tax=Crocosphaera sp. UHCC 0190 TaxID=3110246 RepID=UPI002B2011D0|nr:SUMF1/EgtB/PvdO family nonheme iron enzyme [Crocosphaera sp. UHCC 0190]MEA5508730.1 SUMF1/EgtB/PvdO family nonheme iron enzyme [Crocosphaera sp. UHCC 0190]